ncbi:hypothetical protein BH11ARM1_BH11ARM1_09610 [soil metagenome]
MSSRLCLLLEKLCLILAILISLKFIADILLAIGYVIVDFKDPTDLFALVFYPSPLYLIFDIVLGVYLIASNRKLALGRQAEAKKRILSDD